MKKIIILMTALGITTVASAKNTVLCISNFSPSDLTVSLNNENSSSEVIPTLSSSCKNADSNDKVEIKLLGGESSSTFTIDQANSNIKKVRNNIKISKNLVYDLKTGNYTSHAIIYDTNKSQLINTAEWLSNISDSKLLNQIVIPGSHDAGMSETNHCTVGVKSAWAKTQEGDIYDQTKAGSRYFDIRIDYDHNQLVSFHRSSGAGCNGEPLKDILDDTVKFLTQYKTEFVILKFSHTRKETGHDQDDTMKRIMDVMQSSTYKPYLYTVQNKDANLATDTKLGSVRGKIIAVFDKEFDSYIDPSRGIFRFADYSDSKIGSGFTLFDQYSNSADYETVYADQLYKNDQYGSLGNKYLFLWSYTETGKAGSLDIEQITNTGHGHLANDMYKLRNTSKLPNIVYIDFVNSKITQPIIMLNNIVKSN